MSNIIIITGADADTRAAAAKKLAGKSYFGLPAKFRYATLFAANRESPFIVFEAADSEAIGDIVIAWKQYGGGLPLYITAEKSAAMDLPPFVRCGIVTAYPDTPDTLYGAAAGGTKA